MKANRIFTALGVVAVVSTLSFTLVTYYPKINFSTEHSVQNQTRFLRSGEKHPGPKETDYSGKSVRTSDGSDLVAVQEFSGQHGVMIKGEEGDLTDAKMTSKAKDKTIALARLVQNEWDKKVYLRITDAWDTNNEHSNYSLHYEGRAVDFTTSDKDTNKYSRLAGLAIEAGFDWVHNEADHVHASVKK